MNDGPETFPVRLANLERVISAMKSFYRARTATDLEAGAILEAIDRMESYLKV